MPEFLGAREKGQYSFVMSSRVHRRGSLWMDFRLICDQGLFKDILSRQTQFGYNRTAMSATINEELSTIILLTAVRDFVARRRCKGNPVLRLRRNIPRFYNADSSCMPKTQSERTVAFIWQQCCVISQKLLFCLENYTFAWSKKFRFSRLAIKVQNGSRGIALLFP